MNSIEERHALDDGAQTTIERWGTHGPVMLAVHGMTSSRKAWDRFAQHYGDRFRIYAYDQRGHGDSSGVTGPMMLHRALLDLFSVIQRIGEPIDTLMGHSWGAAVAILGGRRFDVRRVIAIDPMIRQNSDIWYDEVLADLEALFAARGEERDRRVDAEYAQYGWGDLDIVAKKHAVRTMTIEPIERLRRENPPESWDLRRDLEAYPKPLLLAMADSRESIVSMDDLKFARESGGANLTIRAFENQGHNLHRTSFDAFAAEVDAFLART